MTRTSARTVTVIPATVNPLTRQAVTETRKRRVAGYARVSTDSDEQFTSYEAQIDYYTQYIKSHADWEFVKVYTDEGISGLNTKHREGFNEMVEDALDGKIDLIVTKSVSRFARNTVDSLVTIRKLRDAGCECFFEKEGIFTFDSKGELLLTIMSSLAQEESRSISENVTWGQRKRFADGKVSMPYKHFLGFEKGPDGQPKVVPEQAELVRRIYDMFMEGMTVGAIARQLTREGIPTPGGKQTWTASTIQSILTNEKYCGNAILQKKFTVDFLQKKMKVNEGEVPQYFVEHSHEAIISPEMFALVQNEMARRKSIGKSYSGKGALACRVVCGDCGGFFGSKVWNSTDKYRRTVWQCNNKFRVGCGTPHLTEEEITERFLAAFNQLIPDRERLLDDCRLMQDALTDCAALDTEKAELLREMEVISELTRRCVEDNSRSAQDQEAYLEQYNGYVARYESAKSRLDALEQKRSERKAKAEAIGGFMFELRERAEPLVSFDRRLWMDAVDTATVYRDGRIVFKFQNDIEVEG